MYFVNGLRVPGNDASVDIYVTSDTSKTSHKYGMEFTPTSLTWFIDGRAVRTVKKVNGTMFPSKPMGLHLGIWDASQYSSWAGVVSSRFSL
jgi:beta-glucanase (GH16 family)